LQDTKATAPDVSELRQELEKRLAEWRADSSISHHAAELWQYYNTLTAESSQILCEQLRLILSPSLASKLAGIFLVAYAYRQTTPFGIQLTNHTPLEDNQPTTRICVFFLSSCFILKETTAPGKGST
jgi:hypothetical protein